MQHPPQFTIANIVITGSFGDHLDKIALADIHPIADLVIDYTPKKFPALIIHNPDPKGTVLFFASGKYVMTGLDTPDHIDPVLAKITRLLHHHHIQTSPPTHIIKNIVAVGKVGKDIDLNAANVQMEHVIYEPDIFPGMILHDSCPPIYTKVAMLIFSSGKAVCAGLDTVEKITRAFDNTRRQIESHHLNNTCVTMKDMEPIDTEGLFDEAKCDTE